MRFSLANQDSSAEVFAKRLAIAIVLMTMAGCGDQSETKTKECWLEEYFQFLRHLG